MQDKQEPSQKDPQSRFEPRSEPGAGQKYMERLVGNWNVLKTISPPGKDPVVSKGKCRQTMIHKGRYLQSEFTFDQPDGSKSTGLGILGFEPATETFTSTWSDSRSTKMSMRQSKEKFTGNEIVLYGKNLTDGGDDNRHSRTVSRLENGGKTLIHSQYVPGLDGKEFVIMELRMTRR